MKTDANGCSICQPGQESYEHFTARGKSFVQYDYRAPSGRLFSCVAPTLEVARERRDKWLN